MTKAEMIVAVAEKAGMTKKDAEKAVAAVLETVTETLKKGVVDFYTACQDAGVHPVIGCEMTR